MTSLTRNIAIIGAGVSGLSLALALHSCGIPSTIYELRECSYNEGGGLTLTPNALKILDLLGVYDDIKSEGFRFDKVIIKTEENVKLAERLLGSEELFGYDALRMSRKKLLSTLRGMVQERNIPIEYGRRFSRLVSEDTRGVVFEFQDGARISASLLIGADGIHSKVRQSIHPGSGPVYMGVTCLLSVADRSSFRFPQATGEEGYLPRYITDKHGALILVPESPDGNSVAVMSHTSLPDTDRAGWDALRSSTDKLMEIQMRNKDESPDFTQSVLESIQCESMTIWPYNFLPHLDTWTSPEMRVILLGDAAHAVPPSSGQGAAQALEDAYSLSTLLSRVDAQVKFEAAVDWWQKYRMERTKDVLELSKALVASRAPGAAQRYDDDEDSKRRQVTGQKWLYNPNVKKDTLSWIEMQQGKEEGLGVEFASAITAAKHSPI